VSRSSRLRAESGSGDSASSVGSGDDTAGGKRPARRSRLVRAVSGSRKPICATAAAQSVATAADYREGGENAITEGVFTNHSHAGSAEQTIVPACFVPRRPAT